MFEDIQSFFTTRPKRPTSSLGAGASAEDDPAMPAFQKAWKDGAVVEDLFGPNPFTLHGTVGHSGADNFRPDVAKVETLLGDAGYYQPLTNDGPSGWHNGNLDQAIRSFQKDNGLAVDGFLKPNGPTIGKIGSLLGGTEPQTEDSGKPNDPWEVKVGGNDPGDPNKLKPPAWWQTIADGGNDGEEDPSPFPNMGKPPQPAGEAVPNSFMPILSKHPHPVTPEEQAKYQQEYDAWLKENWQKIQQNEVLVRQGFPPIPIPKPPVRPGQGRDTEEDWRMYIHRDTTNSGPQYDTARPVAGNPSLKPTRPADPFATHTINQNGIDANQAYAEMLVRDSDPSQTARMLKRAIDDYGDQGRGDVADLLARFHKIDGAKAEDLRRQLHKATGEMLPYRLAPLGEGFREPTEEEKIAAAPQTPFGSAQGTDRWAAGNMADVLLGRGDYGDAITHFKGEIGRNRAETMPYLAAVHEIMGDKNPGLAARFATQMHKAGLTAVSEKAVEAPQPAPAPAPAPTTASTSGPPKPEQSSTQSTASTPAASAQPIPASPAGGAGSDGGKTGNQSEGKPGPEPRSAQSEGNQPQGVGASPDRPVVNKGNERVKVILENKPAKFEIKDNPQEDGSAPIWRLDSKGKEAVEKYGTIAEEEARKQGVDPNLVKAIMYYENADGHKFGLNDAADMLGISGSVMPMNINPKIWGGLGIDRTSASQPENNIRAAVTLIKRIQDRVDEPTPDKIGSLWNGIMLDQVNQRGARIGRIAKERPWEKSSHN